MKTPIKTKPIRFDGVSYPSRTKLCQKFGLDLSTVVRARKNLRLRYFKTAFRIIKARQKKRSVEQLSRFEEFLITAARRRLDAVKQNPDRFPKPVDLRVIPITYNKVEYESLTELCSSLQILPEQVRRIKKEAKCSYAEAVNKAIEARDAAEIRAFGTVYKNLTELARHKKIDPRRLQEARRRDPDQPIEALVKSLKSPSDGEPKPQRTFPEDPVLFGWRFPSWKAAWEYWKPLGVNKRAFYDYLAEGADIDARCHHELIIQAERGNLTKDLRRVDQLRWSPKQGGPMEKVATFNRFNLKERLAPYELAKPLRKRRTTRQMVKASAVQISTPQAQAS